MYIYTCIYLYLEGLRLKCLTFATQNSSLSIDGYFELLVLDFVQLILVSEAHNLLYHITKDIT